MGTRAYMHAHKDKHREGNTPTHVCVCVCKKEKMENMGLGREHSRTNLFHENLTIGNEADQDHRIHIITKGRGVLS